jgi:hypothetical protein
MGWVWHHEGIVCIEDKHPSGNDQLTEPVWLCRRPEQKGPDCNIVWSSRLKSKVELQWTAPLRLKHYQLLNNGSGEGPAASLNTGQ